MRFRIVFPGLAHFPPMTKTWERELTRSGIARITRILDRSAFDGIYVQEHVVLPREDAADFGSRYMDGITAMAFIAGATERLVLSSNVIVLPFHQPVAHAKAVASLDILSGGRVILCYGVGHFEREFEAVGVPYARRGHVMDQSLEVMKLLWAADVVDFEGDGYTLAEMVFEPKPHQKPHPPIWIGGDSRVAMRRAARHQGWAPSGDYSLDQMRVNLDYIRSQPDFGADDRPFDYVVPLAGLSVDADHRPTGEERLDLAIARNGQAIIDRAHELAGAGATWITVRTTPATSIDEYAEYIEWFGTEVISKCA